MNKRIFLYLFLICLESPVFSSNIDTLIVRSNTMDKDIKNIVITPNSYSKKGSNSFPVVYLLHGAGGNHKAWLHKAPELKKYADIYNVIFVCPDGDKTSWYFDSPIDEKMQYETYVSKELVSAIDVSYRTIKNRENRAISGYSMGGHGALYLGFKHQDVWGAVASMSGGVDIRPFPMRWEISKRLGDYSNAPDVWEENTVINLLYLLKGNNLQILFDCGVDDFFYDANSRLHKKLLERNIPHDYIERPGGHTNKYWKNSIKYHLLFFNNFFNTSNK